MRTQQQVDDRAKVVDAAKRAIDKVGSAISSNHVVLTETERINLWDALDVLRRAASDIDNAH